ncbi:hypothetical protein AVEN_215339-1 [Araneus ventricosus]|uniref:Uncharacterized protein n=1 Tax=Araneus ventricosus TaxID=182803 RepID=A0A4Y2GI32_ARAVE|nr:hypothetical protein AVEN_215339-1 [Araneus ventricosus]
MEDLKNIATIKPKQVPSSKHQHKRRVHQSRKIRWEIITIFKRGDQFKQGSGSGGAQETNKKLAAHPKQISVNVEECISWRLTVGETKRQEAKPHRTLGYLWGSHFQWRRSAVARALLIVLIFL